MLRRLREEGGLLRNIPVGTAETHGYGPPERNYLRMPSFPMTVL
jgi:hypothetical protein